MLAALVEEILWCILDLFQHLTLEGVLEEKDSQLLKLNLECDELRTELDFAKKSVNHQTENNERLQQQVISCLPSKTK